MVFTPSPLLLTRTSSGLVGNVCMVFWVSGKCRRFTKQSQVFPLKFLVGTKLQFRKAQITQKTRRKLYCDYLSNLNHQKLNGWFSLRSAQKSLVYFHTKKKEFLNNALIVLTKSSYICGIRNTSFVHTFLLSL